MGTRVFTFHEDSMRHDTSDLSSAIVTREESLPDHFLICSSHKQKYLASHNARTVYVLYKESNFSVPWFSIGFGSPKPGHHTLYIDVNNNYLRIGTFPPETFLYWVHVCVEVDTITATIKASVNGGNVSTVQNVEGLTPLPKLHLRHSCHE